MAASQQSNMLLSMLNSAGMGSSPQPQQQQQQSFGQSHQPHQGFPQANGTSWAPSSSQSPDPNPTSPQTTNPNAFFSTTPIARTDFFRNIAAASPLSPPAGGQGAAAQASSVSPPPNGSFGAAHARATSPLGQGANGGAPDQATMLLEMFKQMAPSPKSAPKVSTESPGSAGTPTSPRPAQDQKQALLSVFQQSGENGLPREPVITHEKPSVPAAPVVQASPTAQSHPVASTAQHEASAPAPQEPPRKSMFDFVSPFDAFERIPRRVVSKPATPAPTEQPAAAHQASAAAFKSPQPKDTPKAPNAAAVGPSSSSGPSSASTPRDASPATKVTQSNGSSPATGSGLSSAAAPAQTTKKTVSPIQSQSSATTDYGAVTIPLDTTASDHLRVEDEKAVQVQPISILKSVESPRTAGRVMGITSGWMVYTMKNRLRLIDRVSGARLGIPVPQGSQIIDMATSERHLAFISSDGNISVYEVPASWTSDEPPCTKILSIESRKPVAEDAQTIGKPRQVEWIRKNGQAGSDRLAIGGDEGIVIVDVFGGGPQDRDMADVLQSSKVLTAEGAVVGFALNQTHQGLALLSESWHLTLYNVATQNRAWHRRLPSSVPGSKPSSIIFCESQALIGANNNQIFDLVQLTPGPAVITSLQMPADQAPTSQTYATYDPATSTLWLGRPGQTGVLALRYILKGKPFVQVAQGETAVAFSRPVEFPLQRCSSFELEKTSIDGTSALFLCQHSQGFLQAKINLEAASELFEQAAKLVSPPQQEPVADAEAEARTGEHEETGKKEVPQQPAVVEETKAAEAAADQPAQVKDAAIPSAASSPARRSKGKKHGGKQVRSDSPNVKAKDAEQPRAEASPATAEQEVKPQLAQTRPEEARSEPSAEAAPRQSSGASPLDERVLQQMLEQMRSGLVSQTREVVSNHVDGLRSRIDSIGGDNLAGAISSKISKDLESSIETALVSQIKSILIPALQKSIVYDVKLAVSEATEGLPKTLLRQLLPAVQKEMTSTLDKSIEKSVSSRLIPAVEKALAGIKAEVKQMVQLEVETAAKAKQSAPSADPVMEKVMKEIAALGQQMAALQAQLSRQAPPAGPPPAGPPLSNPVAQLPIDPSQPPSAPITGLAPGALPPQVPAPPADLEDRLATAFRHPNKYEAILKFVHEYWKYTMIILPSRRDSPHAPTKSGYIPQAHMLTLLHHLVAIMAQWPRLAQSAPDPGMMPLLADWAKRAAELVDPTEPVLLAYWPRAKGIILAELGHVIPRVADDEALSNSIAEITRFVQAKQQPQA